MISVIVPVYNVEKYLDNCIESIINQTYSDLEIILVDDGSSDNSSKICDDWSEKDNRIIVLHQENQGVSSARNNGLRLAKGEYIGFVDSDDYIESKMYEILLNKLLEDNSDISVCSSYVVDKNGVVKTDTSLGNQQYSQEEAVKLISYKMNNSLWNKLFKAELIKNCRFDENHTFGEDHLILLQILKNVNKVSFTNHSLYYYVQRENSITGMSFNKKSFDQVFMKDTMFEFVKENFPYVSCFYRKLCFTSRENLCRKIIMSNLEKEYLEELKSYLDYFKSEYKFVKDNLSRKEILEYKLLIFSKKLYKLIFKIVL